MENRINIWIVLVFLLVCAAGAWASPRGEVKKGNAFFKKGEYSEAIDYYSDALKKKNSAVIEYNLGTALYKNAQYEEAVDHLRRAAASREPSLKTAPQYNLGNAFYKLGKSREKENLDQAVHNMEDALANLKNVTDIDPKDKDAEYNREVVKKELERLKKEQKKRQDNAQGKDGKNKQDGAQSPRSQDEQDKNKQQSDPSKGQQQQGKADDKEQNKEIDQKKSGNEQEKNKPADDTSGQGGSGGETMGLQEAKDIMDDYQRNQEPKGLLNFITKDDRSDRPVLKDW